MGEIINKVAESGLITLDLEQFYPKEEVVEFDIKDFLFMEMLLKEKEFREQLEQYDWSIYKDKIAAVYCSTDAIIPMWAFMLVSTKLSPYTKEVLLGNKKAVIDKCIEKKIEELNVDQFKDKRVVVKGCGDVEISPSAYLSISNKLLPFVKSLMYGEPCSTVPVYKKK